MSLSPDGQSSDDTHERSFVRLTLSIIAVVVAISLLVQPGEEYPGDADAVRAEAIELVNTGKWAVPEVIARLWGPRGQYFFQRADGNYYPKYGVLNTLMFAPPLWLQKIVTGHVEVGSTEKLPFLNLLNVVLSGITALYLMLLARRYTKSNIIMAIFTLSALFSTFWWNYLRTHAFEIYQTLFLVAFFYHFLNATERRSRGQYLAAAIYFGALCLSKTVYVVLLPAIVVVLIRTTMSMVQKAPETLPHLSPLPRHEGEEDAKRQVRVNEKSQSLRLMPWFWLPVAITLGILAFTNWYKFDSPFATGYTQWEKETVLFKAENIPTAIWGYLFGPHHSVFSHFPLLVLALAAWPPFFRKHRADALLSILIGLTLVLINGAFINWRGQSAFGPRYLLPILPILALPFLLYLDWLRQLPKLAKSVLSLATAAVLLYSTLLQTCVNTLPFFFCYELKGIAGDKFDSPAVLYLRARQFGTIERDYLLYRAGRASPFTRGYLDNLQPNEIADFSAFNESVRSNYYLFPNLLKVE